MPDLEGKKGLIDLDEIAAVSPRPPSCSLLCTSSTIRFFWNKQMEPDSSFQKCVILCGVLCSFLVGFAIVLVKFVTIRTYIAGGMDY
ncbi:unnamed protein product [Nippostrongylus brasiliensis]|uniref:Transmembrane protein 144 n=1 Tax=Nippostrongylus brasiliensis TaxID=27835 RepID=A0A0N4XFP8_NIPBR|nr:unnamed protein product [Nippostrongylus brasiliensis]